MASLQHLHFSKKKQVINLTTLESEKINFYFSFYFAHHTHLFHIMLAIERSQSGKILKEKCGTL